MNTISLIVGALALRTDTFKTLRERSDVYYRGFLVVLVVGLVAGAFAAGANLATEVLHPLNERVVTQEALQGLTGSYSGPPALRPLIESYIAQAVGMVFELSRLPPNSGPAFRPFARLLKWVGESISVPFARGYLGLLLFAGLLVQLTCRWLGGRAGMAQMLGLSALAMAPRLLDPIASLLRLAGNLSGLGVFGPVETLIGLVVFVWGAVIYVKATAIAQEFSYGRAFAAILIGLAISALLVVLIVLIVAMLIGGLTAALVAAFG